MTDVVADAYATMAVFRLFVRDSATTDAGDPDTTLKLLALETAARAIDVACGRTFTVAGDTPTARVFSTRWEASDTVLGYARLIAPIDDVFDDTGLTVATDDTGNGDWGTAFSTGFRLTPLSPAAGKPYTGLRFDSGTSVPVGRDRVKVTALWGWDAIPSTIVNANLIQAARFLKRRDAAFGVAGSPDLGNELRLLAKLDPDVALMVSNYRRYW